MSDRPDSYNSGCLWGGCSNNRRCATHGSCVARAQAGGASFPKEHLTAPKVPLTDRPAGWNEAIELAARIVEHWSLPTIQTPSMWLVDKAGIAAEIRAMSVPNRDGH